MNIFFINIFKIVLKCCLAIYFIADVKDILKSRGKDSAFFMPYMTGFKLKIHMHMYFYCYSSKRGQLFIFFIFCENLFPLIIMNFIYLVKWSHGLE